MSDIVVYLQKSNLTFSEQEEEFQLHLIEWYLNERNKNINIFLPNDKISFFTSNGKIRLLSSENLSIFTRGLLKPLYHPLFKNKNNNKNENYIYIISNSHESNSFIIKSYFNEPLKELFKNLELFESTQISISSSTISDDEKESIFLNEDLTQDFLSFAFKKDKKTILFAQTEKISIKNQNYNFEEEFLKLKRSIKIDQKDPDYEKIVSKMKENVNTKDKLKTYFTLKFMFNKLRNEKLLELNDNIKIFIKLNDCQIEQMKMFNDYFNQILLKTQFNVLPFNYSDYVFTPQIPINKMHILSFNISWEAFASIRSGNTDMSSCNDSGENLCAKTVAFQISRFVKNTHPEFMFFQECNKKEFDTLSNLLSSFFNFENCYKIVNLNVIDSVIDVGLATCYPYNFTHIKSEIINVGKDKDVRPVMITEVLNPKKKKYILINVHLSHNCTKPWERIEMFKNIIETYKITPDNHVIISGDFNGHSIDQFSSVISPSFKDFKMIESSNAKNVSTCCYPYKFDGTNFDLVFSNKVSSIDYISGVFFTDKDKNPRSSDHKPVLAQLTLNEKGDKIEDYHFHFTENFFNYEKFVTLNFIEH